MGRQKELIGTVVSDKMQKTVIVRIMHLSKHHKYGKIIKRYNKYKAHDEKASAKLGDQVKIVQTRPMSKDKRFRVAAVVKKAPLAEVQIKDA